MKLGKMLQSFWRDDRGQTTTEYILMLSVVVMIAMKFKGTIMSKLQTATDTLGTNIDSVVNTNSSTP